MRSTDPPLHMPQVFYRDGESGLIIDGKLYPFHSLEDAEEERDEAIQFASDMIRACSLLRAYRERFELEAQNDIDNLSDKFRHDLQP